MSPMAVSRTLRRLLRVLTIEEDQCRLALEAAIGDLRQLERAHAASINQAKRGRQLVVSSVQTGELPDRLAGLEETNSAHRRFAVLTPRIADAVSVVEARRQEFLTKRVECRQAETLIQEGEARESIIATRRAQQRLDDWYLNRLLGRRTASKSLIPVSIERTDDLLDAGRDETLSEDLPETTPQS